MLLDRLSVSTPLDKPTILHLSTDYRTVITRNFLGILEGRLVHYEKVATVTTIYVVLLFQFPFVVLSLI